MSKHTKYRLKALSQSDCKLGDHLYVYRLHKKAVRQAPKMRGYTHHGIYVGEGRIVDFSGLSAGYNKGAIRMVDFSRFASGFSVYRWSYDSYRGEMYSSSEIAQRARSQIGKSQYNVLIKNCEHFANWCVTGRSISRQIPVHMQKAIRCFHSWKFEE